MPSVLTQLGVGRRLDVGGVVEDARCSVRRIRRRPRVRAGSRRPACRWRGSFQLARLSQDHAVGRPDDAILPRTGRSRAASVEHAQGRRAGSGSRGVRRWTGGRWMVGVGRIRLDGARRRDERRTCVAEQREHERVDRTSAPGSRSSRRSASAAGEGDRPDARLHHEPAREPGAPSNSFGVERRSGRAGPDRASGVHGARGVHGTEKAGERKCGGPTVALVHARRTGCSASGPLRSTSSGHDGPRLGRRGVSRDQRAGCARGVIDGGCERAQQHRHKVPPHKVPRRTQTGRDGGRERAVDDAPRQQYRGRTPSPSTEHIEIARSPSEFVGGCGGGRRSRCPAHTHAQARALLLTAARARRACPNAALTHVSRARATIS